MINKKKMFAVDKRREQKRIRHTLAKILVKSPLRVTDQAKYFAREIGVSPRTYYRVRKELGLLKC